MKEIQDSKIAIIGLGYVGLPLAVAFSKKFSGVIGYDLKSQRVKDLREGKDETGEVELGDLENNGLIFTSNANELHEADIYIVAVPTPIDESKAPDLSFLKDACRIVGSVISKGNVVIFESTVYPGATEEVCSPILSEVSGLLLNRHFYIGYSPERINPGDKERRLQDIIKITSGSNEKASDFVAKLYGEIVEAGVYRASSIRVAEAAKVIENTQRDLNVALMNELAIIFERLNLDTEEVLTAAGSKWNFLPFRPGLVGGHCIGVDPYYLTYKAEAVGYHPEVILAGRRINDNMSEYVVSRVAKLLNEKRKPLSGSRVLVLGLTFKEDCPDTRNSKVINIVDTLLQNGSKVDVLDPVAVDIPTSIQPLMIAGEPKSGAYDIVLVAVAHQCFRKLSVQTLRRFLRSDGVIFDVKSVYAKGMTDARL